MLRNPKNGPVKKKTARQLAAEAAAVDTYEQEPVRPYVPGVITNSPGRPATGAAITPPTQVSQGPSFGFEYDENDVARTPMQRDLSGNPIYDSLGNPKYMGNYGAGGAANRLGDYFAIGNETGEYTDTDTGGGSGGGNIMSQVLNLIGKGRRDQYQDLAVSDYVGPQFREYDGSMYDTARSGIARGLASDAASGATAYGDARTELSQYQDPFTGRSYATNQGIPEAMQRMMRANNVGMEQTEIDRGIQADAAFGNVLALLGGASQQAQDSNMRALAGDERRFNESLASQGRTMSLGVDMTEAQARQQYSQDAFEYGEGIARQNYDKNMQVALANSAGQNQVSQSNTTLANNDISTLIQLLAGGFGPIDPAALAAYQGG